MRRAAAAVAVGLWLAGCAGAPPPRDAYHRIRVPAPAARAEPLLAGVVEVDRPAASSLLHMRPVAWASGDLVLRQHAYHHWTEAPPVLVQEQLAVWLRRAGVADEVTTPRYRTRPDWRITGKLHRFERVLDGGAPRVAVELELALSRHADRHTVVHETYAVARDAGGDGIPEATVALGEALGTVFTRFLADAERALAEAPSP